MKKHLKVGWYVFIVLGTLFLGACNDGKTTPLGEHMAKIATLAEEAIKGIPGNGSKFGELAEAVRFSVQPQQRQASLYSQSQQYYLNEINKLYMYDENLMNKKMYAQKNLSQDVREDIYYQEYLKQNPTHIFHPTQLRQARFI